MIEKIDILSTNLELNEKLIVSKLNELVYWANEKEKSPLTRLISRIRNRWIYRELKKLKSNKWDYLLIIIAVSFVIIGYFLARIIHGIY